MNKVGCIHCKLNMNVECFVTAYMYICGHVMLYAYCQEKLVSEYSVVINGHYAHRDALHHIVRPE